MATCDPHPIVMWELTRACDLGCRNCVFTAAERRVANELKSYNAYKTIDQIAALQPRELILTGGDPLARQDVGQIIDYARRRGLDPALTVSPTRNLTPTAIDSLVQRGLSRMIFSLDASTCDTHHAVHGSTDTFTATLLAMTAAESGGLALEVNTLVSRRNRNDLPALVDLLRPFHVARWNVHFLVPIGGSMSVEMITSEEVEETFARLEALCRQESFALRVVEAPHYRRFLLQNRRNVDLENTDLAAILPGMSHELVDDCTHILDAAIGSPGEFVYISHSGDVGASEFLPQTAGNLRYRPLESIYRSSDFFNAIRDHANLNGKCGRCEFTDLCGGSRARSSAMTGDLFGSDPLCVYRPGIGAQESGNATAGMAA
jgi:AdoMet-dependent heme synthase